MLLNGYDFPNVHLDLDSCVRRTKKTNELVGLHCADPSPSEPLLSLPWEDRDAGPGPGEQSQGSRGAPDMALCLPQPQGPHPLMLVLKIRCDDVYKELRSF